ncbi:IS3 family transposase [Fictibacillus macauensis]|uniref:IS3 family transposase n=1 Tax=Fictibacillus macauensis TaxID=245160 RepID=UPI0009FF2F5D
MAFKHRFLSLNHQELKVFNDLNWYNNICLRSALGYQSPVSYRNAALKIVV